MKTPFLILSVCLGLSAIAQRDTSGNRQVTITSTFKPVLKEAAKINITASPLVVDSARPRLQYQIPNQNLTFAFQPGNLRPLALEVDTTGDWSNESYVKAGFGSLKTPYLQAGIALGNRQTAGLNIYAKHISSQGKRPFQDFSNSSADLNGFFRTSRNIEWTGRFGGLQEKYYKYGYQPDSLLFPEDSLRVKFQTWRGRIGFHNVNSTAFGLNYAPEIRIDVFNDLQGNSESNTQLHLPLEKRLGDQFAVSLAVTANLSRYKPDEKETVNNHYYSVAPTVKFRTEGVQINGGINPSWDNGAFKLFPNVTAEFRLPDYPFSLQLGWIGYLRNAGYQYQAGINPWIWAPDKVLNTQIEERFAGIKGAAGDHLNFSAKVGFNTWRNQPLFVNDTMTGKSFLVVNESRLNVLHMGAELGFTVGDKFNWLNSVTVNQFAGVRDNDKAWGLLPAEIRSSMRLQVLRDLYVNADFYAFNGPWAQTKGERHKLKGAGDLSAGLEFRILKNLKLWAQFNNILNSDYQRWNQYPVYGFNFLGGIVFSFAQNSQ